MQKIKQYRLLIILPCITIILVCLPIYITRFKSDRNFLVGNEILLNLNLSNKSKKESIEKIARYVVEHFKTPLKNSTKEKPFHEMISDGYGFCDQQSSVLLALANYAGIRGRLVFLYGEDSISHHSVAEIYIDKWYMVDPFLEVNSDPSFLLPSIQEVILNKKILNQLQYDTSSINQDEYYNLFTPKYPYKIIHENQVKYSKIEQIYQNYLLLWMKVLGKKGVQLIKKYSN